MVANRLRRLVWLLPCAALPASGFAPARSRPGGAVPPTTAISSSAASDGAPAAANSLDGVAEFEEWFASSPDAKVNNVRHAVFDSTGRGLRFTSTKSSDLSKVAVVPRKLVLNVPYSDEDESSNGRSWDANLACKLWEECGKGRGSAYYG